MKFIIRRGLALSMVLAMLLSCASITVLAAEYNGPIISAHSSKNYREHGKIQQESEKETTP